MARGISMATSSETREAANQHLFRRLATTRSVRTRQRLIDELVATNLDLCDALARRYADRGLDRDDLLQVARAGLLSAVNRYQPDRGAFVAFAIPTITGELKRYFRDFGWVIRPPRRIQELRAKSQAQRGEAEQQNLGTLGLAELSAQLGVDVHELAECENVSLSYRPLSLDSVSGDKDADSLVERLASDDHDMEALPDILSLRAAMAELSERDRLILHWRFIDDETQAEIGKRLGVSQMQVSRIISRILAKMRAAIDPPEAAA